MDLPRIVFPSAVLYHCLRHADHCAWKYAGTEPDRALRTGDRDWDELPSRSVAGRAGNGDRNFLYAGCHGNSAVVRGPLQVAAAPGADGVDQACRTRSSNGRIITCPAYLQARYVLLDAAFELC